MERWAATSANVGLAYEPLVIGLECGALKLQAQLPCEICVWSVQEVGPGPEELKPGKEHLPPGPGIRLDVVEALVGGVAAAKPPGYLFALFLAARAANWASWWASRRAVLSFAAR